MSDSDGDGGPAFPEEKPNQNIMDDSDSDDATERDAMLSDHDDDNDETIAPPVAPVVDNKPNLFASSSEDEDSEQEQEIVHQNDEEEEEKEEEAVVASSSSDAESEKKTENEVQAPKWQAIASDSDSSSSDSSDSDDDDAKSTKSARSEAQSTVDVDSEDSIDWDTYDPELVDPNTSIIPNSPRYEEDTMMHEHERRLNAMHVHDDIDAESTTSGDGKKRRRLIDSSDDEDETEAKRPHEQLEEDDPFAQPLEPVQQKDSDSDSGPEPDKKPEEPDDDPSVSYFEKVLSKKKSERKKNRRRNTEDSSFISEADELINTLMRQMSEASGADKQACLNQIPALAKLQLLPAVEAAFKTKDYHQAFIENGIMTAIADWLAPLPNNALPSLKIRTSLLISLLDLPHCSIETLKASGVGKAVNRLLQHPKELQDNKKRCKTLIRRYSKQIFDVKDTGAVSKEDRQQRDMEFLRKFGPSKKTVYQKNLEAKNKAAGELRVHEKGFVGRARVPMPSNRDYLIRPKSNIDPEDWNSAFKKGAKRVKQGNELLMDKTVNRLRNAKAAKKVQKAAKINMSGTKGVI